MCMFHLTTDLQVTYVHFQLTIDTPVSPATSIVPLVFVISVTAIKHQRLYVYVSFVYRLTSDLCSFSDDY